ncbi:MAG: SAM-dependent methyltransferase [Patescibacteria group bacterium]|nr:SAM-dependent methyltransferase [Patescibacteria group bacterium]
MKTSKISASFRDPSGFIFSQNGEIYRQINNSYQENYELLIKSGLYGKLISLGYLIPHEEVNKTFLSLKSFKTIKPHKIPFISYPYEWCFSMLKAAALLTLNVQKTALEHGMSLKDASAFNVQFLNGKPILIDTLSFERYEEGKPWVAYRQFVEHFLAPLALMSFTDIRFNRLFTLFLDGVPTDLASHLLPLRCRFKPSLLLHIYAHSQSQKRFSNKKLTENQKQHSFSRQAFCGLLESLEGTIKSLNWDPKGTKWSNYYEDNNYTTRSMKQKAQLVREFIRFIKPKTVWDMGANTGFFSRIVAQNAASVISFDNDPAVLEQNYLKAVANKEKNILPLFCDLTNPNPALGWANQERFSLLQRGPVDAILALALIHHLTIAQNIPLTYTASLFSRISNFLIIEFVPKEDSQGKRLLANREDIFPEYNQEGFEKAFKQFFQIKKTCPIKESTRVLYLMEKRKP